MAVSRWADQPGRAVTVGHPGSATTPGALLHLPLLQIQGVGNRVPRGHRRPGVVVLAGEDDAQALGLDGGWTVLVGHLGQ